MGMIVEFGFDLVTRAARTVATFLRRILGKWIAALDHESTDDAMENGAIVEIGAGQLLEILDRLGSGVVPELNDHFSFTRFDDCNFIGCIHGRVLLLVFTANFVGAQG